MYKLISEAEAVGKTVEKVNTNYPGILYIIFTDRTVLCAEAVRGEGCDDDENEKPLYEIDIIKGKDEMPPRELLDIGLINKGEYERLLAAHRSRLKKIYED